MSSYLGDFTTSNTVYVYFNTFDSNDPSASVTLTGLALADIFIYKNGSVTERSSTAGYTLLDTDGIDFDGKTGIHGFSIDLSNNTDSGFYAAGGEYTVVVASVTVDAATVNFVAAHFSIERTGGALALLKGTNSLADIESKIDTLTTNLATVDTVVDGIQTDLSNGTDGLGAIKADTAAILVDTAVIGAAGAGLTAVPWNAAWDAEVQSECADALAVYDPPTNAEMEARTLVAAGYATPTNITAGTITTATNVTTVNGLAANVITAASIATDAGAEIADAVWDEAIAGHLTAGSTGAALNGATAPTAAAVADAVWDEALSGHLSAGSTGEALNAAGAAGDPWTTTLPGAYTGSQAGKMLSDIITDTAVIGAAGAGLTAVPWNAAWDAEVQSECTDALNAYDPPTKAELDSAVAPLATAANLSTVAGYLDTEIAAILADTNELQTDWANGGRLDLILDARASQTSVDTIDGIVDAILVDTDTTIPATLSTISGYIDTEVAAIKAKTDNLPASPAAVGDIPTATQNADALLNRDMSAVSDTNARSPLNAMRFLRNKYSISGTTLTVTKEDDSTSAWTSTLTTNAAADPVTGSDPA